MQRETWVPAAMVLMILGLLVLIMVTPSLLGRPPELASLPLLVIGLMENRTAFVIDVGGAVQAYMYANATLEIQGLDNPSYYEAVNETDTYDVHLRVPVNETAFFHVHALLVDRQDNFFEYNVTAQFLTEDGARPMMVFTFPDETNAVEARRFPPEDFRWLIPRRGAR